MTSLSQSGALEVCVRATSAAFGGSQNTHHKLIQWSLGIVLTLPLPSVAGGFWPLPGLPAQPSAQHQLQITPISPRCGKLDEAKRQAESQSQQQGEEISRRAAERPSGDGAPHHEYAPARREESAPMQTPEPPRDSGSSSSSSTGDSTWQQRGRYYGTGTPPSNEFGPFGLDGTLAPHKSPLTPRQAEPAAIEPQAVIAARKRAEAQRQHDAQEKAVPVAPSPAPPPRPSSSQGQSAPRVDRPDSLSRRRAEAAQQSGYARGGAFDAPYANDVPYRRPTAKPNADELLEQFAVPTCEEAGQLSYSRAIPADWFVRGGKLSEQAHWLLMTVFDRMEWDGCSVGVLYPKDTPAAVVQGVRLYGADARASAKPDFYLVLEKPR